MADYRGKNPRTKYNIVDTTHAVIGIATVLFAIVTLIKTSAHLTFVPVLFGMISLVEIVNTVYEIQHLQRGRKRYGKVLFFAFCTLVFGFLTGVTWIVFIQH